VGAGTGAATKPEQVNLGQPVWQKPGVQRAFSTGQPQSDQMRQIQTALNQRGYDAGQVDGIWGPKTQAAVRNFQTAQHLPATGQLDLQTLTDLGLNQQISPQAPGGVQSANLQAFDRATLTLTDAIARANTASNGSRAMDAAFAEQDGKPVYDVAIYDPSANSVVERTIDANSGQANTSAQSQTDPQTKAKLEALSNAKLTLADAAKAAEQQANGKAMQARVETVNGSLIYDVVVAKNGSTQKYRVDPRSGQVTST
jgi:uncharacterized membrane protein YkoI